MRQIFGLLYAFLFLGYVIAGLFVVYHIVRYSINKPVATFGLALFLVVFVVLLFTNALIFFSLPFETLLPSNYPL